MCDASTQQEARASVPIKVENEEEDEFLQLLNKNDAPPAIDKMYASPAKQPSRKAQKGKRNLKKRSKTRLSSVEKLSKDVENGGTNIRNKRKVEINYNLAIHSRPSRKRKEVNYAAIENAYQSELTLGRLIKKARYTQPLKKSRENSIAQDDMTVERNKYLMMLPSVSSFSPGSRNLLEMLELCFGISTASIGFRAFVRAFDDECLETICKIVTERYSCTERGDSPMAKVQVMRHVWNSMSTQYQFTWEDVARKRCLFGPKTSVRETPFFSKNELERTITTSNKVFCDCCFNGNHFASLSECATHFATLHDSVNFYMCPCCRIAFPSLQCLRSHKNCPDFEAMRLSLLLKGKELTMEYSAVFLSCAQCGFWIPLRSQSFNSGEWNVIVSFLERHSCKKLVPIIVHFVTNVFEKGDTVRMRFAVKPFIDCPFALSCRGCKIERFKNLDAAESHYTSMHSDCTIKCKECDAEFGLPYLYRFHVILAHQNNVMFLANYLSYTATFHPPPGSGGLPYIGYNSKKIVVGGDSMEFYLRTTKKPYYVSETEDVARHKMSMSLNKSKGRNDEDGVRYDMGYDGFDYSELEDTDLQKFARKLKQLDGEVALHQNVRLLNRTSVLQQLKESTMALQCEVECNDEGISDEIGEKITTTFNFPLNAFIDPIKNTLLVRRCYEFCKVCNVIFYHAESEHRINCKERENWVTLFHPANEPSHGISCPTNHCEETFCSVAALRFHLILKHGVQVRYEEKQDELIKTVQDVSKPGRITKVRPLMALYTDHLLKMPESGMLPQKQASTIQCNIESYDPANYPVAYKKKNNQMLPVYIPQAGTNKTAQPVQTPYRPFYVSTKGVDTKYVCRFCGTSMENVEDIKVHTRDQHMNICQTCGSVFATQRLVDSHRSSCPQTIRHLNFNNVLATCAICTRRTNLISLYLHMQRDHFDLIGYVAGTGELQPKLINLGMDNSSAQNRPNVPVVITEENLRLPVKQLKPVAYMKNGSPLPNVLRRNVMSPKLPMSVKIVSQTAMMTPTESEIDAASNLNDVIHDVDNCCVYELPTQVVDKEPCYLCDMSFYDTRSLKAHLEQHDEMSRVCMLCRAKVSDHNAMKIHIYMKHFKNSQVCTYCYRQTKAPIQHLLYHCKRKTHCPFCGDKLEDEDELLHHMQQKHQRIFKRFKCTDCGQFFACLPDFKEHSCKEASSKRVYCNCKGKPTFNDKTSFNEHFMSTHTRENFCTLCEMAVRDAVEMQSHRKRHAIQLSPKSLVYVLHKELVVGSESLDSDGDDISTATSQTSCIKVPSSCNSDRAASSSESVNVVDDDDDEDCIVIEQPTTSRAVIPVVATTLSASIRTEDSEAAYRRAGEGQPGYIEDDDGIEVIQSVAVQQGSAPVRVYKVTDENDDSDCEIVAIAENPGCVLSSTVATAGREKKFKCQRCSSSFVTNASLSAHCKTQHFRADIADTTSNVTFGIPTNLEEAYVCMLCSIAFEAVEQFERHILSHGPKKFMCKKCSGASFCETMLSGHQKAHDQNLLFYACGVCKCRYADEMALMVHLVRQHNTILFYFCKQCFFGSLDIDVVFNHVIRHPPPVNVQNWIGAFPVNLLNFEPRDIVLFKQLNPKMFTPSDCSHRTLLLATEAAVTCKTCMGFMSFASYSAIFDPNEMLELRSLLNRYIVQSPESSYFPALYLLSESNRNYVTSQPKPAPSHDGKLTMEVVNHPCTLSASIRQVLRMGNSIPPPPGQGHRATAYTSPLERLQAQAAQRMAQSDVRSEMPSQMPRQHALRAPLQAILQAPPQMQQRTPPAQMAHRVFQQAQVQQRTAQQATPQMQQRAAPQPTLQQAMQQIPQRMPPFYQATPQVYYPPAPQMPHRVLHQQPPQIPFRVPPQGIPTPSSQMQQWQSAHAYHQASQQMQNQPSSQLFQPAQPRAIGQYQASHFIPTHPPTMQPAVSALPVQRIPPQLICQRCNLQISSPRMQRLHELHDAVAIKWFCLICEKGAGSEMEIMDHYCNQHLQQQTTTQGKPWPKFRCELVCPMQGCVGTKFNSLRTFNAHINSVHKVDLPFESSCGLRFSNSRRLNLHMQMHTERLGSEDSCCSICGTCDAWKVETADSGLVPAKLLHHELRHGVEFFTFCRICLRSFKSDDSLEQVTAHILSSHCSAVSDYSYCQACNARLAFSDMRGHVIDKHVLRAIRPWQDAASNEIVIRTADITRSFMGLNRR